MTPQPVPPKRLGIAGRTATRILGIFGWRVVFVPPPGPKAVVIVYPHTSNFDFPIGVLARSAFGLPIAYAGKDSLFRPPFGAVFRWLGGIPVNRRERTGFVTQLAERMATTDSLYIAITPEGTRKLGEGWKSGFYHLARRAGVPVGLAFIDYARREIGIGAWIEMSGDVAADTAAIAHFYAGKRGYHPEQAAPIHWN